MKTNKVITLLLAAIGMAACSDYDNGYTEEQLDHIQGFREVFGDIDKTNDWNAAEQGTVTVTPAQAGQRIKVYANTFGTYTLVADYDNVTSTQELNFDMLEGTDFLIVSDGSQAVSVNNGDAVSLTAGAKTRTTIGASANGLSTAGVSVASAYTDFAPSFLQKNFEVLPEEENNLGKVSQNFSYVSTGQFTIYPLYWQTSSYHTLGIYWKDASGEYRTQDIYKPRQGDELAVKNADGTYTPVGAGLSGNESTPGWDETTLGSKAITINLPIGTQFGFYLDVYSDAELNTYKHTIYSQSELNTDCAQWTLANRATTTQGWTGNNVQDTPVFAATFQANVDSKVAQFLCFEDWNLAGPDLNDLVFVFTGDNIPTILDDDANSWVLSAEDLGGTFDIDYNDVVLSVNHVGGKTTALVTPLAAGGTLASYIFFGDKTEANCLGEIHSFFGQSVTTSGSYSPVNVGSTTPAQQAASITINVPANFSMATLTSQDRDQTSSVMGGFKVVTIPQGETPSVAAAITSTATQTIQNTATQNDDNVPYVICTPLKWKRDNGDGTITTGNYRWPLEKVAMFNFGSFNGAAYDYSDQYSFRAWIKGENKTQSRYWYAYPDLSVTCANGLPTTVSGNGTGAAGSDEAASSKRASTLTAVYNASPGINEKQRVTLKSKVGIKPTLVSATGTATYTHEAADLIYDGQEGDYYLWHCNLILSTGGTATIVYTQDATAVYEAGTATITVSALQSRNCGTSAQNLTANEWIWGNSNATAQTADVTAGDEIVIWTYNYAGDGAAFTQTLFNAAGTGSTLTANDNGSFTFNAGSKAGTVTIQLTIPASAAYSATTVTITFNVAAAQSGGDDNSGDNGGDDEGSLPFTTGKTFTYTTDGSETPTTYYNASFIDFSGVKVAAGAKAHLSVTYGNCPDKTLYVDYPDGTSIKAYWADYTYGFSYRSSNTASYELDAEQLAKAISLGGLYIMAGDDAPIVVTKAVLYIDGAAKKR